MLREAVRVALQRLTSWQSVAKQAGEPAARAAAHTSSKVKHLSLTTSKHTPDKAFLPPAAATAILYILYTCCERHY